MDGCSYHYHRVGVLRSVVREYAFASLHLCLAATIAMSGSLLLRDYPCDLVRLSCEKCGCASQFRKQNLIARYGADIPLPDLLEELVGCHKRGNDACMLRYVDLIPR